MLRHARKLVVQFLGPSIILQKCALPLKLAVTEMGNWRLPVILTLSQIPVDPCAVLALFVSLELEFDEFNAAFMDEIGLDDAQRTVA